MTDTTPPTVPPVPGEAGQEVELFHRPDDYGRKAYTDQPPGMTGKKHSGKSESDRMAEEDAMVEFKVRGCTDTMIAKYFDVDRATVMARLRSGLARRTAPKVDELRKIMDEQLDRLLNKLQSGIDKGDPVSIGAALKIMDRKAKLYGLDAAEKIEVTVETEADREIKNLMDQVKTQAHRAKAGLGPKE